MMEKQWTVSEDQPLLKTEKLKSIKPNNVVVKKTTIRQKLYGVLEGGLHPWDRIFEVFIVFLIIVNVTLFILSTVDSITDVPRNQMILDAIEIFSVVIFTIEFFARLWCIVEKRNYRGMPPYKARLKHLIKIMSIIDMLAIFPFWIQFALPNDMEVGFISAIRVFRVFRLFKAEKYTRAMGILVMVLKNNREVLIVTVLLGIILFICTSTALYFAERNNNHYESIPSTMYMAILMLTAQAIPDDATLTTGGKIVVGVTAILSVAVFAIPAGLLGWGFESVGEKFQQYRHKKKLIKKRLEQGRSPPVIQSKRSTREINRVEKSDSYSYEDEDDDEIRFSLSGSYSMDVDLVCPTCRRPMDEASAKTSNG